MENPKIAKEKGDTKIMGKFPQDKIVYRLINYNENRSLLSGYPFRRYLDLAVIYEIAMNDYQGGRRIFKSVTQEIMDAWEVDEHTLFEAANRNSIRILGFQCIDIYAGTEEYYREIEETMTEAQIEEFNIEHEKTKLYLNACRNSSDLMPIYMLSNDTNFKGASCILYPEALHDFSEKINDNAILIMSIDEIFAIPAQKIRQPKDVEFAVGMMLELNYVWKSGSEILTKNLYYYERESNELQIIGGIEKHESESEERGKRQKPAIESRLMRRRTNKDQNK